MQGRFKSNALLRQGNVQIPVDRTVTLLVQRADPFVERQIGVGGRDNAFCNHIVRRIRDHHLVFGVQRT